MRGKIIEKLLKDKTLPVFFLSCLEKEKSLEEVAKDWGYNKSVFSKQNTHSILLNFGLLQVTKMEGRTIYFKSNLTKYWDFIREMLKIKEAKKLANWLGIKFIPKIEKPVVVTFKEIKKYLPPVRRQYLDPIFLWLIPLKIIKEKIEKN